MRHQTSDSRLRRGYELVLLDLDESLLLVLLAAHDQQLRPSLPKQARILIQDGAEDWLRSFRLMDVRERGHRDSDPRPFGLNIEKPNSVKLKPVPAEELATAIEARTTKRARGWWRRECRDHKIKGCSKCVRISQGRPKKQGKTGPVSRFNELAHAAGHGPDAFKRAKSGRPGRAETERLNLLAEEGHSLEAIGEIIGGGRQRAHQLLHRLDDAA